VNWEIRQGHCLELLRAMEPESVQTCITSPPYYGLRDYGAEGQLGLEPTLDEFVDHLIEVFAEVRRVLRSDGTLWLNLGDSYATGLELNPEYVEMARRRICDDAPLFNKGLEVAA
jgi:DNA modification methylase